MVDVGTGYFVEKVRSPMHEPKLWLDLIRGFGYTANESSQNTIQWENPGIEVKYLCGFHCDLVSPKAALPS